MHEHILKLLPQEIKIKLERLPDNISSRLEEIRIRENRPLEIIVGTSFYFINEHGELQRSTDHAYKPSREVCARFLERITNYSLYSMEEQLKRGYITIVGGHRIGLTGRTILDKGEIKGLRDITGFNIRIAREMKGSSLPLLKKIISATHKGIESTLIVAPPQFGKTTLIRDIARNISYGVFDNDKDKAIYDEPQIYSSKVAIIDERSEIAACYKGVPSFDVGPRTDVMDACPKAEGMMMMIRSMSPEVIIVDEIGRAEDVSAVQEVSHAGIKIVATVHGYNLEDVYKRPMIQRLIDERTFKYVIELKRDEVGFMHRVIPISSWLQHREHALIKSV